LNFFFIQHQDLLEIHFVNLFFFFWAAFGDLLELFLDQLATLLSEINDLFVQVLGNADGLGRNFVAVDVSWSGVGGVVVIFSRGERERHAVLIRVNCNLGLVFYKLI
jgi:hypothetical protein